MSDLTDRYYNLPDAFSKITSGEYIIANEPDINSSKQVFIVGAHVDLITEIQQSHERRYHEYKFPNRPIKPFLDLETCELSREEFELEVDSILEKLKDYGPFIIFDSSREGKFSLHVIYPYIRLLNISSVKTRMSLLNSKIVDMAVYKKGTLRLPYCTSYRSKPHILKYCDWKTKTTIQDYNREYLKLGMLHYFEYLGKENFTPSLGKLAITTTNSYIPTKTYDEFIYKWAENAGYVIVNYKEENQDNAIKLLLKGVICPKKGGVHKSNNFYLRIDLSSPEYPSYFGCLDCDCKDVKFNGPLFSTILKKEEMEKQLLSLLTI